MPTRGWASTSKRTRRPQAGSSVEIAPLARAARERYARAWRETQSRSVHDPGSAVFEADRLIEQMLMERGYDVEDGDEQATAPPGGEPGIVDDFHQAHAIALAHERGHADGEDLRRALVRYGLLFERLLETQEETARV